MDKFFNKELIENCRYSFASTFIINGNILNITDAYIVHGCNCVTVDSVGLAKDIFEKFPQHNVYLRRAGGFKDIPGTILVSGHIINMFCQYTPGKPKTEEERIKRLEYFISCIYQIDHEIPKGSKIAVPFNIQCGHGGGKWEDYQILIGYLKMFNYNVVIYKL